MKLIDGGEHTGWDNENALVPLCRLRGLLYDMVPGVQGLNSGCRCVRKQFRVSDPLGVSTCPLSLSLPALSYESVMAMVEPHVVIPSGYSILLLKWLTTAANDEHRYRRWCSQRHGRSNCVSP